MEGNVLQTMMKSGKLIVRNGRYVCPNCKQTTNQKADDETNASNLILWCRSCKAEYRVNIQRGQCFVLSRCR